MLDQTPAVPRSTIPHREPWPLWLHFALLLALQSAYAWCYVQSPWLRTAILVPQAFRLVVWTLPVLVFLALERRPILEYLKLRDHALRGLAWGAAVGFLILAGNAAVYCLVNGSCRLNLDIGLDLWVGPVTLVGLSEEVAFRGFLLPKLSERTGFARANILQALIFLLIHVPGWILLGQLLSPVAFRLAGNVLLLALFNGWLLGRTRSLWACMIVHSSYNLASFVLAS
jgi:membrane protease YdiL (CAAX protease family)